MKLLSLCSLLYLALRTIYGDVVRLTEDNFDKVVRDPTKHVLVYFYSPRCRPCQEYAYVYDNAADGIEQNKNCILAKVNVLEEDDLAKRHEVASFPTLMFFPKGNKNGEDVTYLQEHEQDQEQQLTKFLDKECNRPGSGPAEIDKKAGLLEDYSPMVKSFMKSVDEIENVMVRAEALQSLQRDTKMAKYYLIVMKETRRNTIFLEKEYRHLKTAVADESLSAGKREQAYKKMNVLREFDPFVAEKIEMKDSDPTKVTTAEIPDPEKYITSVKVEL